MLNLETYQAAIAGKPLDLTYMEYELLKFLASHPGKVFTRETLLSRVWGYEYYGGARTVDVHIRRLRAKLGEEHANLIQTVRSRRLPLRPVPLEPLTSARGRASPPRPSASNAEEPPGGRLLTVSSWCADQTGRTSCAWSPLGPLVTSNSTA